MLLLLRVIVDSGSSGSVAVVTLSASGGDAATFAVGLSMISRELSLVLELTPTQLCGIGACVHLRVCLHACVANCQRSHNHSSMHRPTNTH